MDEPMDAFARKSLVDQIADRLRDEIEKGMWKYFLPPERSLYRTIKVSRQTLRKAIHLLQEQGVVKTVRGHPTKILLSRKKSRAGTKRSRVTMLFGESWSSVSQWPLMVIDDLRRELYEQGFQFEIVLDLRLRLKHPENILRKLVEQHDATEWILAAQPFAVQRWFQKMQLNAVVMGNTFPEIEFPYVNDDLRAVTRHAAGIFLGLGHQNILYLMRRYGIAGEVSEEAGFKEAFRNKCGVKHDVLAHSGEVDSLRARLTRLFLPPNRPTAVLVSHAMDALVVLNWLMENGIDVPSQVSVISFQSETFLDRIRPLVSCYKASSEAHARLICDLVTHSGRRRQRENLLFPAFFRGQTIANAADPVAQNVVFKKHIAPNVDG